MDSIDAKSRRRNNNKCIGDDTKAAARQSPNCINKTKKYGEKRFSIWRMNSYTLHVALDHDSEFTNWQLPATWHVALES